MHRHASHASGAYPRSGIPSTTIIQMSMTWGAGALPRRGRSRCRRRMSRRCGDARPTTSGGWPHSCHHTLTADTASSGEQRQQNRIRRVSDLSPPEASLRLRFSREYRVGARGLIGTRRLERTYTCSDRRNSDQCNESRDASEHESDRAKAGLVRHRWSPLAPRCCDGQRWSRLSEQNFRVVKWSLYRV